MKWIKEGNWDRNKHSINVKRINAERMIESLQVGTNDSGQQVTVGCPADILKEHLSICATEVELCLHKQDIPQPCRWHYKLQHNKFLQHANNTSLSHKKT
jgi:hypothetical protein